MTMLCVEQTSHEIENSEKESQNQMQIIPKGKKLIMQDTQKKAISIQSIDYR